MSASAAPIPFAGSELHGKSRHVCAFFNSDDEEYRVLLYEQRRIAKELDARVAERTAELAAANEELRRITDAIPQAIIVFAPDGTTLYVNTFVLAYTGLSLEDVTSGSARNRIFHPDDLERVREEREMGFSRVEPFELELRARHKQSNARPVGLRGAWCRAERSSPVRLAKCTTRAGRSDGRTPDGP
ncbi:MAG: PAS domain S-box protein [Anaeromyxobacteraceae bacterium]